ncbi:MAG: serine/threonine protein kinase, partial [Cyanobacteriota bacterium]|nr:serine/threonine protein kinase [Cyanobacteriota bacterium]
TAIYLLTGRTLKEMKIDRETAKILWRENVPNVSPKFAEILDKAIQFYPRDRFSNAKEMLAALQTLPSPIPKTEPSLPPSTVIFPQLRMSKKSKNSQKFKNFKLKFKFLQKLKDWQKATALGVVMGAVLGLGIAVPMKILSSEASTVETVETQSNLPTSFYFIGDSAFYSPEQAEEKRQSLEKSGYENAGLFWGPNYSNWVHSRSYKVYADWFKTQSECEDKLSEYREFNPNSFCGFATK